MFVPTTAGAFKSGGYSSLSGAPITLLHVSVRGAIFPCMQFLYFFGFCIFCFIAASSSWRLSPQSSRCPRLLTRVPRVSDTPFLDSPQSSRSPLSWPCQGLKLFRCPLLGLPQTRGERSYIPFGGPPRYLTVGLVRLRRPHRVRQHTRQRHLALGNILLDLATLARCYRFRSFCHDGSGFLRCMLFAMPSFSKSSRRFAFYSFEMSTANRPVSPFVYRRYISCGGTFYFVCGPFCHCGRVMS